ncbi:MAG: response regulator [Pyrinomonadaceae bacterium]|nr:response regulator [Phycisphaerales bacterium]
MQQQLEILLVEDNPNDLELALHALRNAKVTNNIQVMRDGAEAIEYFFGGTPRSITPCVVLLDLKLPKVSGLEVLKRLKSDAATRMIPVVVLTSSREDRDVKEAFSLGANSYIVKPVDFEGFSKSVGEVGLYWTLLNTFPPT